jgi:hypothetical protein
MRLALGDVVGRDQDLRERQPRDREPPDRQLARRGGNDRPAGRVERGQERPGPGHLDDALGRVDLLSLDAGGLGDRVDARWDEVADDRERRATVRDGEDRLGFEAVAGGEAAPRPLDRDERIDERAVHVEQQHLGSAFHHRHARLPGSDRDRRMRLAPKAS